MALMYVVSFLDRVNIGFAALTMNRDLGFSPQAYGFAAGIFFLGYFLFEVPSNLALQKVGARLWMCRICVTWGLLSMLTAFVHEPVSFCILRFLLGAAEAGLYPGMVLYMTYWFPASTRARFIALFLAGVPLANVIGGADLGLAAGCQRPWPAWLAMDAAPGRHSVAAAAASPRCGCCPTARRKRQMADDGGESDHRRAAGGRTAGRAARLLGDAGGQAHLDPDDPGFLHRHRALWPEPVACRR